MISTSALEKLILREILSDAQIENLGGQPNVGKIQKRYPNEYKAYRELLTGAVIDLVKLDLSMRQAMKISEMLHSENEGLTPIQDVLNMQPVNALTLATLIRLERERRAKDVAKAAANIKHNKPGGSRDRKAMILESWASGKFSTRDICAEQECPDGITPGTARKYLRSSPDPDPWPAKIT